MESVAYYISFVWILELLYHTKTVDTPLLVLQRAVYVFVPPSYWALYFFGKKMSIDDNSFNF